MRALLLLFFTLLAGSAAAQDSASLSSCKDGQADCREECTIEYGGSTRTYDKLGACLQKCKQKYDKCRENQLKIQKDELDPGPESPSAPGAGKPAEQSASSADGGAGRDGGASSDGGAGNGPGTEPGLDGGVPATSDPSMDTTELDQLYDEQLPPPPSAKTKAKGKAKTKAEPPPTEPPPEP